MVESGSLQFSCQLGVVFTEKVAPSTGLVGYVIEFLFDYLVANFTALFFGVEGQFILKEHKIYAVFRF